MKKNINPCLEQHLPDKAKIGNAVPQDAWFDSAAAHLKSARLLIDTDPSGASMLAWASMHNTAKLVAAARSGTQPKSTKKVPPPPPV